MQEQILEGHQGSITCVCLSTSGMLVRAIRLPLDALLGEHRSTHLSKGEAQTQPGTIQQEPAPACSISTTGDQPLSFFRRQVPGTECADQGPSQWCAPAASGGPCVLAEKHMLLQEWLAASHCRIFRNISAKHFLTLPAFMVT